MRKIACFALIFASVSSLAFAQSAQETRGLEEEKRDLLSYTEVQIPSRVSAPLPEEASPELRFLNELYAKRVAHVSDAERVLAILTGSDDQTKDVKAQQSLRKGAAALMFCEGLGIKGGIGRRLFPSSERYALRELVYEDIMQAEGVEEVVTGRELVDMFVRSVDYMEKRGERLK